MNISETLAANNPPVDMDLDTATEVAIKVMQKATQLLSVPITYDYGDIEVSVVSAELDMTVEIGLNTSPGLLNRFRFANKADEITQKIVIKSGHIVSYKPKNK